MYFQRVGVYVSRTEAFFLSVKIGGATFSADLGGSSFYLKYKWSTGLIYKIFTELKHSWWDPKDGDLFVCMAKPEEILVEACSDTDVDFCVWKSFSIKERLVDDN